MAPQGHSSCRAKEPLVGLFSVSNDSIQHERAQQGALSVHGKGLTPLTCVNLDF